MEHYVGIDVSLELSSVCVVDGRGKIVKEAKVASEPEALVCFCRLEFLRVVSEHVCSSRAAKARSRSISIIGRARHRPTR